MARYFHKRRFTNQRANRFKAAQYAPRGDQGVRRLEREVVHKPAEKKQGFWDGIRRAVVPTDSERVQNLRRERGRLSEEISTDRLRVNKARLEHKLYKERAGIAEARRRASPPPIFGVSANDNERRERQAPKRRKKGRKVYFEEEREARRDPMDMIFG